jgi:hypothetical protein
MSCFTIAVSSSIFSAGSSNSDRDFATGKKPQTVNRDQIWQQMAPTINNTVEIATGGLCKQSSGVAVLLERAKTRKRAYKNFQQTAVFGALWMELHDHE